MFLQCFKIWYKLLIQIFKSFLRLYLLGTNSPYSRTLTMIDSGFDIDRILDNFKVN